MNKLLLAAALLAGFWAAPASAQTKVDEMLAAPKICEENRK